MKHYARILLMLVAAGYLSACTTLADASNGQGTGNKVTYEANYDRVWDATNAAVATTGLAVANSSKMDGKILAQRGMTLLSYGENVAVFVKKKTERSTDVEVVSKKAMQTNVFAPDWSQDIHKNIALNLAK